MRLRAVHWCETLAEAGPPGATCAWLFSLADQAALPPQRLAPTPADYRDLRGRTGDPAGRFIARRAVLRHLVGRRCGVVPEAVVIAYDGKGRPLVLAPAERLFCSVSGRGDTTALALSPDPVGIDVEPILPGPIPWSALAAAEAGRLRSLQVEHQLAGFLELWTVKEAYLKALGTGLMRDPASLDVCFAPEATISDGDHAWPLDGSAVRRAVIAGRPVVAACVVFRAAAKKAPVRQR